jgi:hypothetical protein
MPSAQEPRQRLKLCELQPWPAGRYKRFRARHGCVRNAAKLAWDTPEKLTIVKGYALGVAGVWIGHWWCLDAGGRVVDPSWKNTGTAYVAVETFDATSYAQRVADSNVWELEVEQFAPPDLVQQLESEAAEAAEGK